ncbi:MAG: hypothetical protein V3V96_06865 [Acidiferrobacterales bacterium]
MKKETVTLGDRLAVAAVIFVASLLTGVLIWGVAFYLSAKAFFEFYLPFYYVLYFGGFFVLLAFLAPNRAIGMISSIWEKMESFRKALF